MADKLPVKLRYAWVYSASSEHMRQWNERQVARRVRAGYDITSFCTTYPYTGGEILYFDRLDKMWRNRSRRLLEMYEALAKFLADRDVLILYNGAHLHPDFVSQFSCVKVYTCGDDPESTSKLSRPLAPYFDLHLINNIAELQTYRSWGLRNVHFWPLGSLLNEEEGIADASQILAPSRRYIPIVCFCERWNGSRGQRLGELTARFPFAFCAGGGWPLGFLPWPDTYRYYAHSQIGWNLHHSTGPINFRLYELPAMGVMQICDNKRHLAKLFELDREVVGFDTLAEIVEATEYYLAHPEEQRQIACQGWERWRSCYTPDKVWKALVEHVGQFVAAQRGDNIPPPGGATDSGIALETTLAQRLRGSAYDGYLATRKALRPLRRRLFPKGNGTCV